MILLFFRSLHGLFFFQLFHSLKPFSEGFLFLVLGLFGFFLFFGHETGDIFLGWDESSLFAGASGVVGAGGNAGTLIKFTH